MTLKRYALGVLVSSTCIISGVLWYDRANPDIRAEDVAACIAAAVERNYVQTWSTPCSNVVTSTMRVTDLGRATQVFRFAITNSNVIYLDSGTWASNGLDMAYMLNFTNSPCWQLRTNYFVPYGCVTTYWQDVVMYSPKTVTLNGVAIADKAQPVAAGTNFLLRTALGFAPDVPAFTNMMGGTSSWWQAKGFGTNCYFIDGLENSTGGVRYTVETRNLDDIRKLATNMFRTVAFNFAVTGTVRRVNAAMTNWFFSSSWQNPDEIYPQLYPLLAQTITTNAAASIVGVYATETTRMQTYEPIDAGAFNFSTGSILGYTNRQYLVKPNIPEEAFTNGRIARLRVYVTADTRAPSQYLNRTNFIISGVQHIYEQMYYGENDAQTYGWDVDFGGKGIDELPYQLQCPAPQAGGSSRDGSYTYVDGYITTNQTWTLVEDRENPATNAYFSLGPDALIAAGYFTVTPPLEFTEDQTGSGAGLRHIRRDYIRRAETRIAYSALVIDWNHKLFGPAPYIPTETNRPAWMN